jgi:hypothetical protein
MMSGGSIERFTEGWAVKVMGFGKAHYYRRDELSYAHTLCGAGSVRAGALRGLGTWTKCKRCEARLQTQPRSLGVPVRA